MSEGKPKVPEQYGTLKEWLIALAKQGKTPPEMRQITGCSKSYAFRWYSYVEAQREKEKPTEPQVSVEQVTVEEPIVLEEAPPERPEEVTIPEKVLPIIEGKLTPEKAAGLFRAVNDLFPEQHRRPDGDMELLGVLWVDPLNRYLSKVTEGNEDLIIAFVGTILVFSPSIIGVVKDWQASRAAKKKEKEE